MEKIKALLVDDEILMCSELQSICEVFPGVEVVGVCHDGSTALKMVEALKPDVVFLDVQMPGLTGLQVAASLYGRLNAPLVVFATAYDEYALKAFTVNAVDYLLKPFDEHDVERVLHKIRKLLLNRVKPSYAKKITAEKGDWIEIIDSERIQMIYAKDRLVFIQTVDSEVYNSRLTLQDFEGRLDPARFCRCHRNYIVNMDQVKQIANWFNRGYLLVLKGDKNVEVPVSRVYTRRLKEYVDL